MHTAKCTQIMYHMCDTFLKYIIRPSDHMQALYVPRIMKNFQLKYAHVNYSCKH